MVAGATRQQAYGGSARARLGAVRVRRTGTSLAMAPLTSQILDFGACDYDQGGFWDSSNVLRLAIPVTGLYQMASRMVLDAVREDVLIDFRRITTGNVTTTLLRTDFSVAGGGSGNGLLEFQGHQFFFESGDLLNVLIDNQNAGTIWTLITNDYSDPMLSLHLLQAAGQTA